MSRQVEGENEKGKEKNTMELKIERSLSLNYLIKLCLRD